MAIALAPRRLAIRTSEVRGRAQVHVREWPTALDRRRVAWTASLAAALATVVVHRLGLYGLGGDEYAHLLAARRVLDSSTPGFAQLGQYWLPLFHVVELPFTWIDPLYESGLAGSLAASLMFVVGSVGAYQLGVELTGSRRTGAIAALAYGANLSHLYYATIPMLETTIAATLAWSAASLVGFVNRGRAVDVIAASAWCLLATWSHYGAWVLPVFGAVVILATSHRRGWSAGRAGYLVGLWSVLALLGIILWMGWGFYIQQDPLYALTKAGTNYDSLVLASAGADTLAFWTGRPGNLAYAVANYAAACAATFGPLTVAVGFGVAVVALVRRQFAHPLGAAALSGLFVVGFLFLFGGTVGSPFFARLLDLSSEGADYENVRYSLFLAPFLAGAVALLAGNTTRRQLGAAALVVASAALAATGGTGGSVAGIPPASQRTDHHNLLLVRDMFSTAYEGHGLVLSQSVRGGDKVIGTSGVPVANFVTEVNGERYRDAMRSPGAEVDWVLAFPDSTISRRVVPELPRQGFDLVATTSVGGKTYELWRRA